MNLLIDAHGKAPLFQQITEQIKSKIHKNELQPGDALPSMRQLAKDLGVSVITTKRAYEELEKAGYVLSAVGQGTFVAGQSQEILMEWQMRDLENKLDRLIKQAKDMGLSQDEFSELVSIYYEEDAK